MARTVKIFALIAALILSNSAYCGWYREYESFKYITDFEGNLSGLSNNTREKFEPETTVAQAMVSLSLGGIATQVCTAKEGPVYLTSGHLTGMSYKGLFVGWPDYGKSRFGADSAILRFHRFPFTRTDVSNDIESDEAHYNEMREKSSWEYHNPKKKTFQIKAEYDYAFVKSKPASAKTQYYGTNLQLLNIDHETLIKDYLDGKLSFHLYRANSIYKNIVSTYKKTNYRMSGRLKPDFRIGKINYDELDAHSSGLYISPIKVQTPCKLDVTAKAGVIKTNCPSEKGVSGSPLIVVIDDTPYQVGIASRSMHKNVRQCPGCMTFTAVSDHTCKNMAAACQDDPEYNRCVNYEELKK